jgi:hypothetical protein
VLGGAGFSELKEYYSAMFKAVTVDDLDEFYVSSSCDNR